VLRGPSWHCCTQVNLKAVSRPDPMGTESAAGTIVYAAAYFDRYGLAARHLGRFNGA
jgi:hypothetical protein